MKRNFLCSVIFFFWYCWFPLLYNRVTIRENEKESEQKKQIVNQKNRRRKKKLRIFNHIDDDNIDDV